ncbi:hypothetical protein BH24CHL10_BH24CHL10_11740 [soil metagenome]
MDDLRDRYARLVAAFSAGSEAFDPHQLAADAESLAAEADSTWLRSQARALAAASRAIGGAEWDFEAIVDDSLPPLDSTALARLNEQLPGPGPLAERRAAHDVATSLTADVLRSAAEELLRVFRRRAVEDLELPIDHALALAVVERPAEGWHVRFAPAVLTLNASAGWTADRLIRVIPAKAYPGRHLSRLMRLPAPEWSPSPEMTVDCGLAAVGREILMADHELAHEIERIGRLAGLRWSGERIVAVSRARADLAPMFAAVAHDSPFQDVRRDLWVLGVDAQRSEALITRWQDPAERARSLARAAGPPLVRAWLVTTGQTTGLQRLLAERLVPTILRADMVDAAG